jgi:hypothetical protein
MFNAHVENDGDLTLELELVCDLKYCTALSKPKMYIHRKKEGKLISLQHYFYLKSIQ